MSLEIKDTTVLAVVDKAMQKDPLEYCSSTTAKTVVSLISKLYKNMQVFAEIMDVDLD